MGNELAKALKRKTDAQFRVTGADYTPSIVERADGVVVYYDPNETLSPYVAGKNVVFGTSGNNRVINAIMNLLTGANIEITSPDPTTGAVTITALQPQATETTLGGIKAKAKTTESNEAAIDPITGKLYVSDGGGSGGSLVNQKNGLPLKLWVGLESEYVTTNPIDSDTLYFRKGSTNFGKISIGSTVIIGQPSVLMNVTLNKTSTKSANTTISNGYIEYVTNGNKSTDQYVAFSNSGDGNPVYVQIDLAEVYDVSKIVVWRYFGDGRTYNNTKVSISPDGTTWTDVFDSAVQGVYPETSAGKTVEFSAKPARYVRVYGKGSNQNTETHLVEVEVYAEVST